MFGTKTTTSRPFSPRAVVPAASGKADHYLGLDLLRGIAALGVVFYHCSSRLDLPLLVSHGYLAVDFFFALSGFVIAGAYGERLADGRLTLRRFAVIRVIRLMPLVVAGTLLAAVIELGRPGIVDQQTHLRDIAIATFSGALLIPTLVSTTLEYVVFPLNGPFWSLSLEAVANATFAASSRSRGRVGPAVLVTVLVLCAPCLAWATWTQGTIAFGVVHTDYWLGYFRIGWSFSIGILLYRHRDHAPRVPFFIPTVALVALMLVPPLQGSFGRSFDLCSVLVALPAIVWTASTARFGPRGRRWSAWSGDLSYPVYALHYPIIRAVGVLGSKLGLAVAGRFIVAGVSTALIVIVAATVYAVFDVPVRRWLATRLLGWAPSKRPAHLRATT